MNATQEICTKQFVEAMTFPMEQRLALLAKLGAKFMKTNQNTQEKRDVALKCPAPKTLLV